MHKLKIIIIDLLKITFALSFIFLILNNNYVRPRIKKGSGYFKIEKREHKLLGGITGHTFLEMRDSEDNVLHQIHGLATDENGEVKMVGNKKTDKLKVWIFDYDLYQETRKLDIGDTGVEIASGTKDYINVIWDQAAVCKEEINSKDISYPRYGFSLFSETENSNSVTDTLISCMQLENRDLGIFTPGKHKQLLK